LIHGWGGSGRYWRGTVERLGDRFGFVVPDLLGFGRSLPVRRGRDIFDQVDALELLLQHLNIPSAHMVGHSTGGAIAMVLAARRPDLVQRLVLTSVGLFRNTAERNLFNAVMGLTGGIMRLRGAWMADVPFLVQQSARRYFVEIPNDPELLRAGFLDYLTMDYNTALKSARSAVSDAIPEAARRIQAPTLLIAAREDQSMPPANVEYTATVIPHARIHWIARSGHLPMVEQLDKYVAALGEFLSTDPTNKP
ncbi:MAG TPA: alpha/beta hydrolase, partial [Roseiflexaceae bacterium]|nr:alpha/beta hydrolase [Roseiflexaceae bacterium]